MSALEDLPPSRISAVEVPLRGRKDHRTGTIESLYDSVSDSCSCTYLIFSQLVRVHCETE